MRNFCSLCNFTLSFLSCIYIYIYVPPSSYPAKLEKTLNRKRGLRRDPGGRNSAGEFPRRCNDADYSPLLVHLSCKLLSARGPTVKFPQRATWPRPDQPLRVKFSASLFRWIGGSSERVEWDRGGGPYSARVLRTAYVIVASSFLFLLAVRPRRHSIHSNFNFGGSKWHYVTEIPSPPIIRSLRRICYSRGKDQVFVRFLVKRVHCSCSGTPYGRGSDYCDFSFHCLLLVSLRENVTGLNNEKSIVNYLIVMILLARRERELRNL